RRGVPHRQLALTALRNHVEVEHARDYLYRPGWTGRRPVSPGATKECTDRHHPAPAPAVRGHDEPPDHLSALLCLRASELLGAALQLSRRGAQPGLVRSWAWRIIGLGGRPRLGAVDQSGGAQLLDRRILLRSLDRHAASDAAARNRGLHLDRAAREPV